MILIMCSFGAVNLLFVMAADASLGGLPPSYCKVILWAFLYGAVGVGKKYSNKSVFICSC